MDDDETPEGDDAWTTDAADAASLGGGDDMGGWTAGDFLNGQGLLGMSPPASGLEPFTPMPSQAPPDLTPETPDFGDLTLPPGWPNDTGDAGSGSGSGSAAGASPPPNPATGQTGSPQTTPANGNTRKHGGPRSPRQPLSGLGSLDHASAAAPMHAPQRGRIGGHGQQTVLPLVGVGALGQRSPAALPLIGAARTGGASSFPWQTPAWLTRDRPL